MSFSEAFRVAWEAMASHKLRSLLTMLGIIIGVGAVVGLLAIGDGYSRWIDAEFERLGIGTFYVNPRVDSPDPDEPLQPRLTAADAAAIMAPGRAPAVEFVVVELSRSGVVSAGGERYLFGIKGVTPSYFAVGAQELGDGRWFDEAEERAAARVAVIGDTVAETLFGSIEGAVGRRISVNGVQLEVVGVSVTKQSQASGAVGRFGDPGEQVYLPYSTARSRLFRNEINARVDVSTMTVKARDLLNVDEAIRQVTMVLREEHRLTYQPNDFSITNPAQLASQFRAVTVGFSAFLGTIGGISLLVGGIGIMNIMLVSVTQRTREIGLRKAVGAKRRDILLQFLIEAVVLCLFGGLLGIGLGYLLSLAGTAVLANLSPDSGLRATVSLFSIVLATSIAAGVGLFFGLFPALRAARLDPIRALRNE
ncbi:MAG: ABC transporter permease [Chloroflexi bacterium]|nr:ABC transporter permease [Chloroflexota bacterium]